MSSGNQNNIPNNLLSAVIEYTKSLAEIFSSENSENRERGSRIIALKKSELQKQLAKSVKCNEQKRHLVEWRLSEIIQGEKSLGRRILRIDAALDDKGLVGTSSGLLAAALEVGLAWDYVLDLPLISGSTVKGAFTNLVLLNCARLNSRENKLACLKALSGLTGWTGTPRPSEVNEVAGLLGLNKEDVLDVAHMSYGRGGLIFHDVHLICNPGEQLLEGWVITPHYKGVDDEYDVKPTPIEHVVLRPGLKGSFIIGVEKKAFAHLSALRELLGGGRCQDGSCLAFLASLMIATLSSGVGARTSLGYSRFTVERILLG